MDYHKLSSQFIALKKEGNNCDVILFSQNKASLKSNKYICIIADCFESAGITVNNAVYINISPSLIGLEIDIETISEEALNQAEQNIKSTQHIDDFILLRANSLK